MSTLNVTKRGDKWQYRFEAASVDGKRKRVSKSGFKTKKEAVEAGTIALVGQITTISKYRIYDPLSTKNALHGIRVSDATLDLIDSKIKELFTHSN